MNAKEKERFLERLFEEHYELLYRYALHYLHYDPKFIDFAEDCVQETFIKAMKNCSLLARHPNQVGWLVQCCKNILMIHLRRQWRKPVPLSDNYIDEIDSIREWAEEEEAKDNLIAIYAVLTPKEKAVYKDFFIDDLSQKDTAIKNHFTFDAVHTAIQRIRKKAKSIIKKP